MGRLLIRGFLGMDQKSEQESMAAVERWPLWGGFQRAFG